MKNIRQNGFVLILIIAALAVIEIYMFVLTEDMNTIYFQANASCLEAEQENLITSGLAWAEKNVKGQNKDALGRTVILDVNEMNIRGAILNVNIQAGKTRYAEVQINTKCSRGRRSISHTGKYQILLEPQR